MRAALDPGLASSFYASNGARMPESQPPIDLHGISFAELQKWVDARKLPPVDRWDPPYCGHSRLRIAADGTWYHDGTAIRRPAMVRLFSTVLRREADGRHMLVTPVEKLEIEVERTAFRAIAMETQGEGEARQIAFQLDSGDALLLGPAHPLELVEQGNTSSPRLLVRHGLEAELARPVYYELAEIALAEGQARPGVWSEGCFFPLENA